MATFLNPHPPTPLLTSNPCTITTPKPPHSSLHLHYTHPSFTLLELCSGMDELHRILPHAIKSGLSDHAFFQTKIISLLSGFGDPARAALLLDRVEEKFDELYHSVLKGHARSSRVGDGFSFFARMRWDGVEPVVYNFTYLLKACGDRFELGRGRELHCLMVTSGYRSNVFAMTAVLNMYAKCRRVGDARKMFDEMPERDLVAWNAMVACYAQNGVARRALEMVVLMQEEGIRPDSVTVVTVLPACADLGFVRMGRSIHAFVTRAGIDSLVNVSTALLDMYSKCEQIRTACLIFDRMKVRNVISWNSMIDGYAQSEESEEALRLFHDMLEKDVKPTDVTIMAALHACADLGDLEQGRLVHELLIQNGLESDVSVMNSLIAMYSKCKRVDVAAEIFENLQGKTRVSWNAMILGYAQNDHAHEALSLFCRMQKENVKPDSFTLVSVIPAVADYSVLKQGKWMHGYAIRTCLEENVYVMTALVDMYAKCGGVAIARKLFDMMQDRHVTTWNAMIDGYGTHGHGKEAIQLFEDMMQSPVKPNAVTFLCMLSSCSHSGFIDKGLHYFNIMQKEFGIEPVMDHYGSIVDLLGRSGRLEEAWDFIQKMPIVPEISVFGAMLGACKIHKNVELGEKAAYRLFELDPQDAGYHVLLANIYAAASMWDKVAEVRRMMEKRGLKKNPGITFIEFKNKVHTFYSGCTNHPQSEKIYERLEMLINEIKGVGYVPDNSSIHDVEEDVKVQLLNSHSEKLAISFALINTKPGTTIQIRKNLRVCGDCHNATKFISLVTNREIIVRDMHRFHHFKDGHCSCGDYW